jgi:CBS domain-containing protein
MKTIRVAEVCQQTPLQSLIVHAATPLSQVIHAFASRHDIHGIFLVDDDERVIGIINNQDLLLWARVNLDLPLPISPVTLGQVRRLVLARNAHDLARPRSEDAAVRLDDTLETALARMAQYNLTAIPVLDSEGRVFSDLRLSEILAATLQGAKIPFT